MEETLTIEQWAEKYKANLTPMTEERQKQIDIAIEKAKAEIPIIFNRGRFKKEQNNDTTR